MSRKYSLLLFILGIGLLLFARLAPATGPETTMDDLFPLQGTEWWVEDIAGKGVIDSSHTTIAFPETNRVGGDTGCNRYFGTFEGTGHQMHFGPLAGTRRACPEALMNQEMAFYQAMEQVRAWHLDDETKLLHLLNDEGEAVLRAWQVENSDH